MARRVLTWFIESPGFVTGDTVAGVPSYILDDKYEAIRVVLHAQQAPGVGGAVIDIKADGVSLFDTSNYPTLPNASTTHFTESFAKTLNKLSMDTVVTVHIRSGSTGKGLTVSLELE